VHAGGQPAEAADDVRVFAGTVGPPAAGGLEERARPGADELARVPERTAGDPDLDGRMDELSSPGAFRSTYASTRCPSSSRALSPIQRAVIAPVQ
jgi:hypothetical protein